MTYNDPIIDVIIPTVVGREASLDRCLVAYANNSVYEVRPFIIRDKPTCGIAWNVGADLADVNQPVISPATYIHFSADDLEPLPGWDRAAVRAVEEGFYPAALVQLPDGRGQYWGDHQAAIPDRTPVNAGYVPFMSWPMWNKIGPSLNIHYGTDNWLSWKAERAGFKNVYVEGFAFKHHSEPAGRGAGMSEIERRHHDGRLLVEAQQNEERFFSA